MLRNSSTRYGSRSLASSTGRFVILIVPCGWVMYHIGTGATQNVLYGVLESTSVTVFVLTAEISSYETVIGRRRRLPQACTDSEALYFVDET
jgi:hypothetical protein